MDSSREGPSDRFQATGAAQSRVAASARTVTNPAFARLQQLSHSKAWPALGRYLGACWHVLAKSLSELAGLHSPFIGRNHHTTALRLCFG